LSVRAVEDLARMGNPSVKIPAGAKLSAAPFKQLSKDLAQQFSTRVVVKGNTAGKGRIEISFKTADELERIKSLLAR
jgi:ParB-like chromosome segregation protein Spo0J